MHIFTSIHNHSEYSNLRFSDSTIKVSRLIDRAVSLGYSGVCLTDHEALSGHVKFLEHYKKQKQDGKLPEGFKVGLGNEIYLVDRDDIWDTNGTLKPGGLYYHFLLVAKDPEGYAQLRELSTRAWEKSYRTGPMERVPTYKAILEEVISANPGHVIASTACLGGELAHRVLTGEDPAPFLKWCKSLFGRDFYLEMQPQMLSGTMPEHDQFTVSRKIAELSEQFQIPYIVTTDTHYLDVEDRLMHHVLLNSDSGTQKERETEAFYQTTYMMSLPKLEKMLCSHLPEDIAKRAIANTEGIYDALEEYDLTHPVIVPVDTHLPDFQVAHLFRDWYDKYPYIKQFAYSEDEQERYFLYLIENGFKANNQPFTDETTGRIDQELATIARISERLEQPLARYYVLVRELIHNILWKYSFVGAARGSVTGFYTAWLTGITQVNPLEYDLPAFRHLHESRPELPDIDTDVESLKRPEIFQAMVEYYGADRVLQTLTYRTLSPKSAVLAACKGLDMSDDISSVIASYVPFERGMHWPLKDCFEGNQDKGRLPVDTLIHAVEASGKKRLKEMMFSLEGLIVGRGIHASSQYVFNQPFIQQNSLMRAPSGVRTTAYNMEESDLLGGLKMDLLVIEALDKMHVMVDMLIADGILEDKGSIKANYDAYVHPSVIDYDDSHMWELVGSAAMPDLFQCDTEVGRQAMGKIRPTTVQQMASANSLMRLMPQEGEESPVDVYVKFKNDISLWYAEMEQWGLTPEEIKILEPLLLPEYGVAAVQESIMQLVMDPHIADFSMRDANVLRKAVAKKKPKLIEEIKEKFYEEGKKIGTSLPMLNYVWQKQISRQLGYSFSLNHTTPYSIVALQEASLVSRFGMLYWGAAVMSVNAGATVQSEQDITRGTDYSKVALAVENLKKKDIRIALPDINRAAFGFHPDSENNEIVFALKAIRGIGDEQAKCIIDRRPYASFENFTAKCGDIVKPSATAQLIKAGAFDKLESRSRYELMVDFYASLETGGTSIKKLTARNLDEILALDMVELSDTERKLWPYIQYARSHVAISGTTAATTWIYVRNQYDNEEFFSKQIYPLLRPDAVKIHTDGYTIVKRSAFDKAAKKRTAEVDAKLFRDPAVLQAVNWKRAQQTVREKHPGNLSSWEMNALLFYDGPHELAGMNPELYHVDDFFDLPEDPVPDETYYGGTKYTYYELTRIVGTVLGKNMNTHEVKLLTLTGLVTVKMYKEMFIEYNRQISAREEKGVQIPMERSWFQRGTKLLFTGFRRGDQFVVRTYRNSVLKNPVALIKGLNNQTGELTLRTRRTDRIC